MRATVIVGFVLVLVVAHPAMARQDSLSAAKDLYASAAFEDALSILTRLNGAAASSPETLRQIDEYRAFCLYALGRTAEAESVVEAVVRNQPLARLDAADASPRIELMFTNVRKRLLPSLIRERFQSARAGLGRKDFPSAEPHLAQAHQMLAEAERLGVKDEGLADLAVLVDSWLEVIRSTAEDRRPATARTAAAPVDAAPAAPTKVEPAAAPAEADAVRTYSPADEGVSPPVPVDQQMPPLTAAMLIISRSTGVNGILDVLIDENGEVAETVIRRSLTPSYDALLLRAARHWKYRPATKDGVPVRYVKTIVLVPQR